MKIRTFFNSTHKKIVLKRPFRENKKGLRGTKLKEAARRKLQNG